MMKYETYKPSEVQLLGDIPSHWAVKRNKDFCLIKGRIGFRGYTKDDFVDEGKGALVIGATEMNENGYIYVANPQFISWFKYYESPEIILETGDILVVQRGSTVGKVAIVDERIKDATINPSLVILKKIKIDNKFLLFYLMSANVQGFIKAQTATTAIPMISQDQIGKYEICIPPPDEQTAIAQYLDAKTQAIDKKINLLTKKAETYKELRKSIINDAVCKGLDKKVKLKESGIDWIGKIPEHWEVQRIKDIFSSLAGGTPSTKEKDYWIGEIPWIPSGKVQNNIVVPEVVEDFISEKALKESSTKIAKQNSILIALTGATCSNIGYLTFDTTINQSIVALLPKSKLTPKYYFYFLISGSEKIRTYMTGGAQGGINQEDVKFLKVLLPLKEEQTTIANYLDEKTQKIDAIVSNIGKQIDTLKELRKTLINDVVTGKIMVNG